MSRWLARWGEEFRQRRFRRAFRIEAPSWDEPLCEELQRLLAELPGAQERAEADVDERALVETATKLWRAQRTLASVASGGSRQARQASRLVTACLEALADAGVVVQDHDSTAFSSDRALEVLAFEEDPSLDGERVLRTVRPSVYLHNRHVQIGQVIVGFPPGREHTPPEGARHA